MGATTTTEVIGGFQAFTEPNRRILSERLDGEESSRDLRSLLIELYHWVGIPLS